MVATLDMLGVGMLSMTLGQHWYECQLLIGKKEKKNLSSSEDLAGRF